MKTRAGIVLAGVSALALLGSVASASAQELSEHAVRSFMEYAWSLTPQQFSKPDGTVIQIDKNKKDDVEVPLDVARDVIKAGRLSAHAQICELPDDQINNHRAMMRREEAKQKWSQQQLVYISQLHLTTVMLLTGRIRLVEKQGDKEVVVDEKKAPTAQSCSEEQRQKVKELIAAYVAASPTPQAIAAILGTTPAPATAGGAPAAPAPATADGSQPALAPDAAMPAAAEGPPTSTGSTSLSETSVEKK